MATTFLSPGVYIEETSSTVQTNQGISASTAVFCGFTTQGPVGEASLVTSMDEFGKIYGEFSANSFLTHNVTAFFANGGSRAYILRIIPGDAVASNGSIQSKTSFQDLYPDKDAVTAPDGTATSFVMSGANSVLKDNGGNSHIVPASLTIKYRGAAASLATQTLRNRGNTGDVALVNGTANYEARINPSSLTTVDPDLDIIVPGPSTPTALVWNPDGVGDETITITAPTDDSSISTITNGNGSVVKLDHRTGLLSVRFVGADIPNGSAVGNLRLTFTPTTATINIVSESSVDTSGRMGLTGSTLDVGGGIATNHINVVDGGYTITFTAGIANVPHNNARVLATYKIAAWEITPISGGTWGDKVRVQVQGANEHYNAATGIYDKFNVFVSLKDANNVYQLRETFEELDFSDSSDAMYFADVINDDSDLINVNILSANEPPLQLNGVSHTQILAGGTAASGANQTINVTTGITGIAKRSVSITYTDNALISTKTITDDGSGNLIGDVDGTYTTVASSGLGPNKVNYTTGEVNFKTATTIRSATLVSMFAVTSPEETLHIEDLGDTTKDYSYTVSSVLYSFYKAGLDGTFSSVEYGRSQFTLPSLRSTYGGIYAIDKIEEILNVCVPDFAGDVTITQDLIDYADARALEQAGGDRFIILNAPVSDTSAEAVDWFRFQVLRSTSYAAIYWQWIKVQDPLSNNRPITVPSIGHIAGVYARTDSNKNVGKSPGGTIDGRLNYLIGLEQNGTLADRDLLYSNRINPLISSVATGTAVWGVRTISDDSRFKLINARRLFMFVEKSVFNLTQWSVFENNGPVLWATLKAQLTAFLSDLFNRGYFGGNTPTESFAVTVDSTNNNQSTIDAGQLFIDLKLKPAGAVEIIRARFQVLQNAS